MSGVTNDTLVEQSTKAKQLIAIGCAITSKKITMLSENNIGQKFQFFYTFLPSFCRTASHGFIYKFYLAYDSDDRVFTNERLRNAFQQHFYEATTFGSCRDRGIIIANLFMVQCFYAGQPARAQNDAMIEAYVDHADYFYRINDDTSMLTEGWTEKFILTLKNYDPALVGVVGPKHFGGNINILTYDFVHRTHIDIFGFYYPHIFTDCYADWWITRVYTPNRSTKVNEMLLVHTLRLGMRHRVYSPKEIINRKDQQLEHDKVIIER